MLFIYIFLFLIGLPMNAAQLSRPMEYLECYVIAHLPINLIQFHNFECRFDICEDQLHLK